MHRTVWSPLRRSLRPALLAATAPVAGMVVPLAAAPARADRRPHADHRHGSGDDIPLDVPEGGATVTFVWDRDTHVPSATVG